MKSWVVFSVLSFSFLTGSAQISIDAIVIDLSCHPFTDSADGAISLDVSGGTAPYIYQWQVIEPAVIQVLFEDNLAAGAADQNDLYPGLYGLTVTDNDGNSKSEEYTVSSPEPLDAWLSFSEAQCDTGDSLNIGSINPKVSGGTAPYSYNWETEDGVGLQPSTMDQVNLGIGTYKLTITDANGCTEMKQHTFALSTVLSQFSNLKIETSNADCTLNDGSVTLSFTDDPAVEEIQFSLDGGVTWLTPIPDDIGSVTYDALADGSYDLFIRDAQILCIRDLNDFNISSIAVSLDLAQDEICLNASPINLNGGFPEGGNYLGVGVVNNTFDPLLAENYTRLTIEYSYTDAAGCIGFGQDDLRIKLTNDTVLDLNICDNSLPYWMGDIIITGPGTYQTEEQLPNGCTELTTYNVTVSPSTMDRLTRVEISEAELPYLWNGILHSTAGFYAFPNVNEFGCSYNELLELIVKTSSSTSIHSENIAIYPNPTQELVFIDTEQELSLSISSKFGQLISKMQLVPGKNSLDVSSWNTGIHFLHFSNANARWTEKIVVTR